MKVLFVGPSLSGHVINDISILRRPPAAQGDVYRAVVEGACAIGLVDGYFGATASVWHKEILFAIEAGVKVLGGASMGAIRAADCAAFGMEPVGQIANAYLDGSVDDDAFVAICHGPAEVGFAPTSDALVDAVATVDRLLSDGLVSAEEAAMLRIEAHQCHFSERTAERLTESFQQDRAVAIQRAYAGNFQHVKRRDALELVERLKRLPLARVRFTAGWRTKSTPTWRDFAGSVTGQSNAFAPS